MGLRQHALQATVTFKELRSFDEALLEQLHAVEVSAHADPWSKEDIAQSMSTFTHCIGLFIDDFLIGFTITSLVVDEGELYTIGINPKYQGLGFGHRLLHMALWHLQQLGARTCFLEVRVSNEVAIHLYDYYGFETQAVRAHYYPATETTPCEDAFVMSCALEKLPELPEALAAYGDKLQQQ